jgi:hypothetical protein
MFRELSDLTESRGQFLRWPGPGEDRD